MTRDEHRIALDVPAEEALAAVSTVAEDWGAEWQPDENGGRLYLPVVAGLRRGVLEGRLSATSAGVDGTDLILQTEATHWRVHRSAAAVLVMGALGALPVLLWPLSPDFLALAPVGLVFLFLAWFMVVSRLRTAGAEEFLAALRDSLSA